MNGDPFGTAAIRERVLAGWAAAPVRFREDANAEEDHALGGYRDRVLIELAQNAADAARRAGVPGRLLFAVRELDGTGVLVAANTGAPLDADGVQALATLRASAKRADAEQVGRFGVGFSAVLAVSDEPVVLSRHGSVRFSRPDTHDLVHESGSVALATEVARRDGHVPTLRLPFPAEGEPPAGYDTAVLLPLRDGAADDLVRRLLAELDDALLLALPGLHEVQVEVDGITRTLTDVDSRWFLVRRTGSSDAGVLADRPTEERDRRSWSLTWAVPRRRDVAVPGVLYAPTPTDEPLGWRALLIASFPLEASRRHVAPGPATDALVAVAATAYAELVAEVMADRSRGENPWSIEDLVPTGFPAGALDGALREAAVTALRRASIMIPAEGGRPIRPRDAVALAAPAGGDPAVVAALAPSVAGLVLAPRRAQPAMDILGVQRITLSDLIEQLPVGRAVQEWRELYDAFGELGSDPLVREALAAIPVPLTDGRVVRGVRGAVLVDVTGERGEAVGAALAALGIRAVHPTAAHPLLERLGAQPVSARSALDLPEVRAAVEASLQDREDGEHARIDAVLTLVAEALGVAEPGEHRTWLGLLALIDAEGEIAPAAELVLPGSPAADLLDEQAVAPVALDLLERWGADVLRAVGVLDDLVVVQAGDVVLDEAEVPESLADLPDAQDWVHAVLAQAGGDVLEATAHDVVAVRDLDAVRESAWPAVLARIGALPRLREAVIRPVRVVARTATGLRTFPAPSWTAWWLRRELFEGRRWAEADTGLVALLGGPPPLVTGLDGDLRRALGGVASITDLDHAAVSNLLEALADPGAEIDLATALRVWHGLATLAGSAGALADDVPPPDRLRAVREGAVVVVEAADAVVVDHPAWLQRGDLGAAVVVAAPLAAALADLLDLPLAALEAAGRVEEEGSEEAEVPDAVRLLLPGAPARWCEHEDLRVDGVEVSWWVDGHGEAARVHASTVDGLSRGLAWAAGAWHLRDTLAAVLDGAVPVAEVLLDEAL